MRREFVIFAGVALSGMAASAAASELQFFHTPSGNIHCLAFEDVDANGISGVSCEILEISKRTLPAVRPGNCDLDWGNRIEIGRTGPAVMSCYGDTLAGGESEPLAYGRTLDFGAISCRSSSRGLECRNASGHGFFLSKSLQRIF
jgi:hypothetical protein